MKKEYNLEGIKCAGCANTVKERFSNVPGVTNVEVSLENKVATVEGDASVAALQASLEERFSPGLFCVFSPFLCNPWLEEVNKVERCEKYLVWFRRTLRIL